MDLGGIISAALTGGTGGLIGVIGNVANTFMSLKQQAQEHDFQLKMMPLQMQMKQAEANAQIEQTKADVAKVVEMTAGEAFTASQKADAPTGNEHRWVLDIKGLVRPVSLFLLGIGTVAIYTAGTPSADMKEYITRNIICDFSMALSWYFGARASSNIMAGFKSKAGQ